MMVGTMASPEWISVLLWWKNDEMDSAMRGKCVQPRIMASGVCVRSLK